MSEYNGYTNWETWNVNLWIGNEEPLYREKLTWLEKGEIVTASRVQYFGEMGFPNGTPDMDETDNGMAAVNWTELAELWEAERQELDT